MINRGNKLGGDDGAPQESAPTSAKSGKAPPPKKQKRAPCSARTKQLLSAVGVGVEGEESPADYENWSGVEESVWPGLDTKFSGDDPENGQLNLPRYCGIKENHRGEGCEKNSEAFRFFSLFFTPDMVEIVVSETQKHVEKLAAMSEPPQGFMGRRRGDGSWPPEAVKHFSARFKNHSFSKAYLYRFLAALIYIAYQCPSKSIKEAWSMTFITFHICIR